MRLPMRTILEGEVRCGQRRNLHPLVLPLSCRTRFTSSSVETRARTVGTSKGDTCDSWGVMAKFLPSPVSYTHLRAHETRHDLVCRLLLEKKKKKKKQK